MYKTKRNQVFKIFIALCILISAFINFYLYSRPAKIVLEVKDFNQSELKFTYSPSEDNPPFKKIVKRSQEDTSHVILVLLTQDKKHITHSDYDQLISSYNECEDKTKCVVFSMAKEKFLEMAKERKDNR